MGNLVNRFTSLNFTSLIYKNGIDAVGLNLQKYWDNYTWNNNNSAEIIIII